MSDWSHGYHVAVGYTFGFYRETAPGWLDFALAVRGVIPPRGSQGAPFRYLELGSGQGFGLCLLAAANPHGEFLGIDFSPEHIAHSQALAGDLGLSNIRFVEGDFAALGDHWPAAFGVFDYVVLHGIYSWVPTAIRHSLVAILEAAARPGAAVYLSHNAMPGWASSLPFQHVLRLLDKDGRTRGLEAIEAGRTLFEQMAAAGSGVTQALPGLKQRVDGSRDKPGAYLMQEYLHDEWHPMWCSQVMGELAEAKLGRAASATMAENLLPQILPARLQEVLAGYDAPLLREDLTDCLINQVFRRDIYVRGQRKRLPADTAWQASYRLHRVNGAAVPEELAINTAFGTVKLARADVDSLFEAVGEKGCSLAALAVLAAGQDKPHLFNQRLLLLIHGDWLFPSRQEQGDVAAAAAANRKIAAMAAVGAPYKHLAAAQLGSAIAASESELLMLDAHAEAPAAFEQGGANLLQQRFHRLGRRLAQDGRPLSDAEARTQLDRQLRTFRDQTLPLWRSLGVID